MKHLPHKHEAILKKLEKAAAQSGQFYFSRTYYSIQEPEGCRIAFQPQNKRKNKRNFWGFPFDHNLVTSIPYYINASPMEFGSRRYIAAQGPRKSTFKDFWHMIWAEDARVIVSVTNEKERMGNRIRMKFEQFWPESGSQRYGLFHVRLIETQLVETWNDGRRERIWRRNLELSYGDEVREINHFHMENWLDDKIIHHESLCALAKHVDACKCDGTIVVHCAAGVGRTGTFIAFHSLYHELLQQLENEAGIELDVAKRVQEMRLLRWGSVVGHSKQYALLIEALRFAFEGLLQKQHVLI
jgi:protein tyrosine phosphatase